MLAAGSFRWVVMTTWQLPEPILISGGTWNLGEGVEFWRGNLPVWSPSAKNLYLGLLVVFFFVVIVSSIVNVCVILVSGARYGDSTFPFITQCSSCQVPSFLFLFLSLLEILSLHRPQTCIISMFFLISSIPWISSEEEEPSLIFCHFVLVLTVECLGTVHFPHHPGFLLIWFLCLKIY